MENLGIFYDHLVHFSAIGNILWLFGMFRGHLVNFFPVLVFCAKKNLTTLINGRNEKMENYLAARDTGFLSLFFLSVRLLHSFSQLFSFCSFVFRHVTSVFFPLFSLCASATLIFHTLFHLCSFVLFVFA
jgi:hypothetical protein